jgi:alpha-1,3-fucosyltransferase
MGIGTDFPNIKFVNQTYVLFLDERPGPWHEWLRKDQDRLDLIWSYRHDAHIPYKYHVFKPKSPSSPIRPYKPKVPLANKSRSIVWPVSNCRTSSKRELYVKELEKYIDVHVYGSCGSHKCPKLATDRPCLTMYQYTYKFYLSFENRICQDYITEKFFNPLEFELVPIVLGGTGYESVAPPHSYIDVRDFKTPRDLARYLHHVMDNEEEYYGYFSWKNNYYEKPGDAGFFNRCVVCDVAHNNTSIIATNPDHVMVQWM